MFILLWPIVFGVLLFTGHFIGAWLAGTYIVASNTIRWHRILWYRAAHPGDLAPVDEAHYQGVVPHETSAYIRGGIEGAISYWFGDTPRTQASMPDRSAAKEPRALQPITITQAKILLMLGFVVLHQIYQASVKHLWNNPLVFVYLTIIILSTALVFGIGAAWASGRRLLFRLCTVGLAVPWLLIAVLYLIYGISQLVGVVYVLVRFRGDLGKLVWMRSFWMATIGSVITGSFWTVFGNSLRKNLNTLANWSCALIERSKGKAV